LERRWRQRDLADQVEVLSRRVLGYTISASERTISRRGSKQGTIPSLPTQRPVHPDHPFVVDPAKADFYAVDVYSWLGADDAAESFAGGVLEHSLGRDGAIRAPMRRSEALPTLGTVAARRGE